MAAKRVTSGGIAKRGDVVCRTHVNTITHADHKRVRITYSRASTFREDQGLIAFDCFLILFHFFFGSLPREIETCTLFSGAAVHLARSTAITF